MVTYGSTEKCQQCNRTVYATEKIVVEDKEDRKVLHKGCLRCKQCDCSLTLGTYASMNNIFYCKPHFKQLFATKGNYDEGFGTAKHTEKWTPQAVSAPTSFVPVESTADKQKNQAPSNPEVTKKFTAVSGDKCTVCQKTVYATEKVVVEDKDDRKVLHKGCLRCKQCDCSLTLGTYASMNNIFYCKPHFKQLFATKGNYDEGFGTAKHTEKWTPQAVSAPTSFVPVESTADKQKNQAPANPEVTKKFSAITGEKCTACQKTVYSVEKVVLEGMDRRTYHNTCLRCSECQKVLNLGTLAQLDGVLYCKPHLKLGLDKANNKRVDTTFAYLEGRNTDYVPSAEKVEQDIQNQESRESEMDRFKRLSEMKHVEDKPVSRPVEVQEEEKKEEEVEERQQEEKAEAEEEKKEQEEEKREEEEEKREEEEEKREEEAKKDESSSSEDEN